MITAVARELASVHSEYPGEERQRKLENSLACTSYDEESVGTYEGYGNNRKKHDGSSLPQCFLSLLDGFACLHNPCLLLLQVQQVFQLVCIRWRLMRNCMYEVLTAV